MENEQMKFGWHPRALRALGPELVTNDLVAILELAKNSYDACAKTVNVIFEYCESDELFQKEEFVYPTKLIIEDNGSGMTIEDIKNYWFIIGTPNKENKNKKEEDGVIRQMSGSKGIGRLSAARLGKKLTVHTKSLNHEPIIFSLNWNNIFEESEFPVIPIRLDSSNLIKNKGTVLIIEELNNEWKKSDLIQLSEGLRRLISPFEPKNDFSIDLIARNKSGTTYKYPVQYPKFLDDPVYKIDGVVDNFGSIHYTYKHTPLGFKDSKKPKKGIIEWKDIYSNIADPGIKDKLNKEATTCGEFSFDVRCWDIDPESTQTITNLYDISRSEVRNSIRFFKGISVYRDDILVLPKDESNRDWLGLDLRRVSRVGDRISTNQIVGCVLISKENNPLLEDASDREGLTENLEVVQFKSILLHIIKILQIERSFDRTKNEPSITDLFSNLNADQLLFDLKELTVSGQITKQAIVVVEKFAEDLEIKRKSIETHFRYYGQLATLGQISGLILHELRNGLMPIGIVLDEVKKKIQQFDETFQEDILSAHASIIRLEELTKKFAPLSSRNKRSEKTTFTMDAIEGSLLMLKKQISDLNIQVQIISQVDAKVNINQGDLELVLINLLMNSIYWLSEKKKEDNRKISIETKRKEKSIEIAIIDNGPGVPETDILSIFEPGITRKPNGIGMGLPICVYLLDQNEGSIYYEPCLDEKGAKFVIVLKEKENSNGVKNTNN